MSRVLRHRILFDDGVLRVISRRYAPAALFERHRDDLSRITLTLGGGVAEDTRQGSVAIGPGDVLLKSRTAVHENRYAPAGGALQVSFEFLAEDADSGALRRVLDDVWSLRRGGDALRLATAALEAAIARDACTVTAAANDMASAAVESPSRRSAAPRWLASLKDELQQDGFAHVDVAHRARSAGVHPVHASRLFRACYGATITSHAQEHAVRRAIGELAAGESLSHAAASAGFYDQSHMSRVFRRITGRTPGMHRRIYADAAC